MKPQHRCCGKHNGGYVFNKWMASASMKPQHRCCGKQNLSTMLPLHLRSFNEAAAPMLRKAYRFRPAAAVTFSCFNEAAAPMLRKA